MNKRIKKKLRKRGGFKVYTNRDKAIKFVVDHNLIQGYCFSWKHLGIDPNDHLRLLMKVIK